MLVHILYVTSLLVVLVFVGMWRRRSMRSLDMAEQLRSRSLDLAEQLRVQLQAALLVEEGLRRGHAEVERKNDEYFKLIEHICAQRDHRWRMFLEQSTGHLHAQAMLEKSLTFTRQLLAKAVLQLNSLRREIRLPEVNSPEALLGLDAPPIGTAARFEQAIEKVKQDMDEPIDGLAERDRIAGSTQEAP